MLLVALLACRPTPSDTAQAPVSLVVPLRWVAEDGGLSRDEVESGLAWSLSNLGALPPPSGWLTETESDGYTTTFALNLEAAGFDARAREALEAAVAPIQASDEMAAFGAVDVGRFLMRTLYSPWRYYSITGACDRFDDWSAQVERPDIESYGVTLSLLSSGSRLITLNAGPWADISDVGFVTYSGDGVLFDPTVSDEAEVIDLMSNGQQRYAVFDGDGALVPAADPAIVPAGQPGKCMWCHEGALMTGTPLNPTTRPHLSYLEWKARMVEMQSMLETHRAEQSTAVDFETYHAHTYGELLVREFLYPTPARVAAEWGIPMADVNALINSYNLALFEDEEYPDRGDVLARASVDVVYAAEVATDDFAPLTVLADEREAPEEMTGLDGEAEAAALPKCWRP